MSAYLLELVRRSLPANAVRKPQSESRFFTCLRRCSGNLRTAFVQRLPQVLHFEPFVIQPSCILWKRTMALVRKDQRHNIPRTSTKRRLWTKVCLPGFRSWGAGVYLPTLGAFLQICFHLRVRSQEPRRQSLVPRPFCSEMVSNNETRGLTNSFGVFQTYYRNVLLPDIKPLTIAWIGSIQIFLMMLIGVCAEWLIDGVYLQFILVVGTTMTTLGIFMLSLTTKYWQILLAQAILCWYWQWTLRPNIRRCHPLIFSEEAHDCYRYCCYWK